jgi:dolichyl-diphosphooligosaccharide--protein glycosyltransferase
MLYLVACTVAAFVLRALPFRNYLGRDGEYLLGGPDSYDHLRRIMLGIKAFPGLPPYDYYYGFPHGIGQVWAPLFDYLLSALALAAGLGSPTPALVTAIGFWLPPVAGSLTVIAVYLVARQLSGRLAGLTAALVTAVLPAHILYTYASRLDHHPAEPLVCLLIVGVVLRGVGRAEQGGVTAGTVLTAAGAYLLALLVWRGSVIFWAIGSGALFVHLLCAGSRDSAAGRAGCAYACRFHGVAALLLVPVCGLNLWGTAGGVTAGIVSWFHVLLLAGCALAFLVLGRCRRSTAGWGVLALLLVAAGGLLLPVGRTFGREVLAGLEVVVGSDPWLASIDELQSILTYRTRQLDIRGVFHDLSLVYLLTPLLVGYLGWRWRRGGFLEFCYPLAIVWIGGFWLLPLFRVRYAHLAAVTTAVAAGLLATWLQESLKGRLGQRRATWLAGAALLLLCLPTVPFLREVRELAPERHVKYDLAAALSWLRDNTPPTAHYDWPVTPPEYGVLADWGLGAHLVNVGQRPALATNFGWEIHGLYESAAFQVLDDPAAAGEILRANRIRYLLLNQLIGSQEDNRAIIAFAAANGKYHGPVPTGKSQQRTMFHRLLVRDGSASGEMPALGRYRLVYESANTYTFPGTGPVSHYKIFEYLPGARLAGTGPPGTVAELELKLSSPIGRVFAYRDRQAIGSDGRYAFRVPYPTEALSGIVRPLGPYLVRAGGRTSSVRVPAASVYQDQLVAVH